LLSSLRTIGAGPLVRARRVVRQLTASSSIAHRIRPRWEYACGWLPSERSVIGSYSSGSSPVGPAASTICWNSSSASVRRPQPQVGLHQPRCAQVEATLATGQRVVAVVPVDGGAAAQLRLYRGDGGLETFVVGRKQPGQPDVQRGGTEVGAAVGGRSRVTQRRSRRPQAAAVSWPAGPARGAARSSARLRSLRDDRRRG
jgi:hypothetical protein